MQEIKKSSQSIQDKSRRKFFGIAFGAVAAVGGAFTLFGIKKTWEPLPSIRAAGFTIVDLSTLEEGKLSIVEWRKKPIFILKKTQSMSKDDKRDVIVDGKRYTIVIGLCTHLGCVPTYYPQKESFLCACHGGQFDCSGNNTFGPPPRPLDIPPFKIDKNRLVLGEEGKEYKMLVKGV